MEELANKTPNFIANDLNIDQKKIFFRRLLLTFVNLDSQMLFFTCSSGKEADLLRC